MATGRNVLRRLRTTLRPATVTYGSGVYVFNIDVVRNLANEAGLSMLDMAALFGKTRATMYNWAQNTHPSQQSQVEIRYVVNGVTRLVELGVLPDPRPSFNRLEPKEKANEIRDLIREHC